MSSTKDCLPAKVVLQQRSSSNKGCFPQKVVFHRSSSSTEGHLPPKVVFHRRSTSTEGCLTPKVVFHRRPPKVFFHQRSAFTYHNTLVDRIFFRTANIPNLSLLPCLEVASPPKVVFYRKLSSTEGRLPPTMTPKLILYL